MLLAALLTSAPRTPLLPPQRYNGAYVVDLPDPAEDQSPAIEKECHGSCLSAFAAYEACAKRIEDKPDGHCTGQYLDYWECIDKCSAGVPRERAEGPRAARGQSSCVSCCSRHALDAPSRRRAVRRQKVCAHPWEVAQHGGACALATREHATVCTIEERGGADSAVHHDSWIESILGVLFV